MLTNISEIPSSEQPNDTSLVKLSDGESGIDSTGDSNGVTRKRKSEELESELLLQGAVSSEPPLKKAKEEEVRNSDEKDESRFYDLGIKNGEKEALKNYLLNSGPVVNPYLPAELIPVGDIYQPIGFKLSKIYEEGFRVGYYYYGCLLESYYKNYLKAYDAVMDGKSSALFINRSLQDAKIAPERQECIKLQAIAGHKEGTEFANLMIANHYQKNHLAFFKLQIQRLTKLYEASEISWARQQSFIATLHPKAWENRSYILRNYFYPKLIEYTNESMAQYDYTCKEETLSHFIFFQLLFPNKFELSADFFSIVMPIDIHNELTKLRSVDSLAKSVRWDDNIFFDEFLLSITKSPSNQPKENLRKGCHKKYTVFGHGIFERIQKVSPYNLSPEVMERKKAKTSLHQSTSLITEGDQLIFGHNRRNKLVGYIFKPSKLINRVFFKDMGTVSRPYQFHYLQNAEAYYNEKVLGPAPTMFKTLAELKQHIINDTKSHNEVLARLKWDINTSCIAIFSDTFEARCIAQFYAKLTYRRLFFQYLELDQTLPQDYKVPIVFYLPGSLLNWQIYSTEQQANDKIKSEAIFSDEAKIKEAFDQNNFEFLLLLDDLDHLIYQNLPVLFWCAYAYSLNIAEALYRHTNSCFLVSFEEYLKNILLNTWRLESHCLYAERRNIFLSMALKLAIKGLPKKILKTKLIDEDNSNQYGNLLFQLVEAKRFQLLTEILTSQIIDLDEKDEAGNTLLHVIAKANHLPLAKLLIEKGVNKNIRNKSGETPLVGCIQGQINNSEMIKLLLDHSNPDYESFESEANAIRKACILLNKDAVRQILLFNRDLGRVIHLQTAGKTLLHYTILSPTKTHSDYEAQIEIIKMLLAVGVDTRSSHLGETALELAQLRGLVAIVDVIEASMNQSDVLPFVPN